MRQEHRAGEKTFVDYAGQTVPVTDPKTGEVRQPSPTASWTGWFTMPIASNSRERASESPGNQAPFIKPLDLPFASKHHPIDPCE